MTKSKEEPSAEPFLPPGMTFPDISNTFKAEGYGDLEAKSPSELFVRECLDWIATWFERNGGKPAIDTVKPFMIIFDSSRLTKDVLPSSKPLHAFRNSHELQVGGYIYASTVNLRQIYGLPTALDTCPKLLGFLSDSGLASATAIAVSPESRLALVHSAEDPDEAYRVSFNRVSQDKFDFTNLDNYLKDFYDEHLSTHEGFCDIWAKATERKLKQRPERQIQKQLQGYFRYAVLPKSALIDREVQTYAGREDLRIISAKTDKTLEGAVMELKVLSPAKSDEANLAWAKQGVDQAANYAAADIATAHRYVCCYDARKVDTPMPDGVTYAASKVVAWRRYFMQTPGCNRTTTAFDS